MVVLPAHCGPIVTSMSLASDGGTGTNSGASSCCFAAASSSTFGGETFQPFACICSSASHPPAPNITTIAAATAWRR
eukprot:CAMPEP_0182590438 /NCGR_PEP_ID=MMETSP1324-20130603/71670_1 /TAXON_ID=236786 /ORGANISM="Florenciella sp., Strain RCC1587" /LENGTH=76 /DNA_ID=CAMNT_0024807661 /DNA_START=36 /DNA_END=262 /DNA_ORIENTATION=-